MEKMLNQTRVSKAKQRRQDDPNLIFRDIKKEAPKPCQTLLHACQAKVMEVDEEEQALVVDPPQSWDPSLALLGGNQSMDIIHAEAENLGPVHATRPSRQASPPGQVHGPTHRHVP